MPPPEPVIFAGEAIAIEPEPVENFVMSVPVTVIGPPSAAR